MRRGALRSAIELCTLMSPLRMQAVCSLTLSEYQRQHLVREPCLNLIFLFPPLHFMERAGGEAERCPDGVEGVEKPANFAGMRFEKK